MIQHGKKKEKEPGRRSTLQSGCRYRNKKTRDRKGYKNFYKYVIPKIVVNYADEGAATCTDVLTNIVLSKRSFKAAQGDKSMKVDLDGIAMGGIKINGLDA